MAIYYGQDAINFLGNKVDHIDQKSSSHWNRYHENFKFSEGNFDGIQGFGSNRQSYSIVRAIVHYILQTPFRVMGKKFDSFKSIFKIAGNILNKQNKGYSLDVLRQVISLAYLNDNKVVKKRDNLCNR
jgi:hypothetical protein